MTLEVPTVAFHGTTLSAARKALTKGLRPRRQTAVEGNWEAHPSIDTHVYLSTLYAPYFAACAGGPDDAPAVLEIDLTALDEPCLMPDEDFIEQAERKWSDAWPPQFPRPIGEGMESRMNDIRGRIMAWQGMWPQSLALLGNVAYRGVIPPGAIRRAVACTDTKAASAIIGDAIDPTITLDNARFVGSKYAALSRWWVGDSIQAADLDPYVVSREQAIHAWGQKFADHMASQAVRRQEVLDARPGMVNIKEVEA